MGIAEIKFEHHPVKDSCLPEPALRVIPKTLSDAFRLECLSEGDTARARHMIERGEGLLPLHLSWGMGVRNWMRQRPECVDWSDHELDDNWMAVVYRAVGLDPVDSWFVTAEGTLRYSGKT